MLCFENILSVIWTRATWGKSLRMFYYRNSWVLPSFKRSVTESTVVLEFFHPRLLIMRIFATQI